MIFSRPLKFVLGKIVPFNKNETINPANLGSGDADATTYLAGDSTWKSMAAKADVAGAYVSKARSFASNYTPNTTRPTIVTINLSLDVTSGQTSSVDILIGGVTISTESISLAVIISGTTTVKRTITIIVPINTTYRLNSSGSGTATILSVYESTM